jgi:hypothetical protein
MESRLKRYDILKFKGLDCNYKMKTGVKQEFCKKFEGSGVRFIDLTRY